MYDELHYTIATVRFIDQFRSLDVARGDSKGGTTASKDNNGNNRGESSEYEEDGPETSSSDGVNTNVFFPLGIKIVKVVKGTTTTSNVKGTGYGGSAMDVILTKKIAIERNRRCQIYDEQFTVILRKLNHLLYQISHYQSNSRKNEDIAFDHPLLFPMLLGPGYADGMVLAGPSTLSSTPEATTLSSSSSAANKKKRSLSAINAALPARSIVHYIPESKKNFNNSVGDGVRGGSVLYTIFTDFFRASLMDLVTDSIHRNAFSFILQIFSSISKHQQLVPTFLYSLSDDIATTSSSTSSSSSSSSSSSTSSTAKSSRSTSSKLGVPKSNKGNPTFIETDKSPLLPLKPYRIWYWGEQYWDDNDELTCSDATLIKLFTNINYQANIFISRMNTTKDSDEVLFGTQRENQEYSSVLDLSNEINQSFITTDTGVMAWFNQATNILDSLPENWDRTPEMDATNVGSSVEAVKSGNSRRGKGKATKTKVVNNPVSIAFADSTVLFDPTNTNTPVGRRSIDYKPSSNLERQYKELLQDEAFVTIPGLKNVHTYSNGIPSGNVSYNTSSVSNSSSSSTGGTNMKRHMKVSVELASMTSLAISWGSSIIIRTDETSMNLLRSFIIGPSDTPYMNGCWFFDIGLPNDYPTVPPSVQFLNTGQGTVRMNPNLYANGKVCLSLLGTWVGPSWSPDTSTLSQVLMSIQSQIFNDVPYTNEPGFEGSINTAPGKRAIANYNTQVRLATLRYGMYEVLRSIPSGFERVIKGHFYYKREEIMVQIDRWIMDAQEVVLYEEFLYLRALMGYKILEILQNSQIKLPIKAKDTVSSYIREYTNWIHESQIQIGIFSNGTTASSDQFIIVRRYLQDTFQRANVGKTLETFISKIADTVATEMKQSIDKVYAEAFRLLDNRTDARIPNSYATFAAQVIERLYFGPPVVTSSSSSSSSTFPLVNTSSSSSSSSFPVIASGGITTVMVNSSHRSNAQSSALTFLTNPQSIRGQFGTRSLGHVAAMMETKSLLTSLMDKLTEKDLLETDE